jgi:hypothetical protein
MYTHGKVPMFKMKPHKGSLLAAVVVLVLGIMFFFEGHRDPGDLPAQERSKFIFVLSIVISGLLVIVATARMWFAHLWHDRYR